MRNSPSSARISVRRGSLYFCLNRTQLVDHDLHHETVAAENRHQALDQLQQLGELGENLLPLETGQALELHVQDGLGLNLGQAELRDQPVAGLGRVPASRG